MWIECETYIGPCRRQRRERKGFRLLDRRRGGEADRMPSVQVLLRQLRASALDLSDEASRRRFRLRLKAAIDLARRTQANATAQHLERLNAALTDAALRGRGAVLTIESCLEAAAAALPR